ncbi:MAG: Serine acetyltransferase [Rhodocyclaceae bacterium]|nr:hypothetical protein [Zoogloeaceae bacterium]MBV6409087.1 Serine acetyltransferase [Rhodocyclaceae bacterium]
MNEGTPISAAQTRERLRADRERVCALLRDSGVKAGCLWLCPSWQAVWLHRWSHFHFANSRRLLARALWHFNLLLTGADISPMGDFGPGLLIRCPLGVVMLGKSGANLSVHGHGGMGGGISAEDIGAGPGLPVLGANVCLHFSAFVLGPVRIGDGAVLGPRCVVTRDVPAGGVMEVGEPRLMRIASSEDENVEAA